MERKSSQPLELFYCYAHKDRVLRDRLNVHLAGLRHSGLITAWYDGEILPGTPWEQAIKSHLESAHLILLLVSPDFIHSDYCYSTEMIHAIERHHKKEASVIPILLRPSDWVNTPFSELQMLPSHALPITRWSDQDDAFADVAAGIRRLVEHLLAQPSLALNPSIVTTSAEPLPSPHLPHQQQEEALESNTKLTERSTSQTLGGTSLDGILIEPSHEKDHLSPVSVQSITKQAPTPPNRTISSPISQEVRQDAQAITQWPNPDDAFEDSTKGIRQVINKSHSQSIGAPGPSIVAAPTEQLLQGTSFEQQKMAERKPQKKERKKGKIFLLALIISNIFFLLSTVIEGVDILRLSQSDVTNLNDDGPGSLRQALLTKGSNGIVTFADNLRGTVVLTSGEINLTKDVSIRGPGADRLSISGDGKSRIFSIAINTTVNISGLQLINGMTTQGGGAIDNSGNLTLSRCVITKNRADGTSGGGIYNRGHGQGTLNLIETVVSSNYASGYGGGIANDGFAQILQSTVAYNVAETEGGGINNGYIIRIQNSTISQNTSNGGGGGIGIGGGGQASLMFTTFYGNKASEGGNILNTSPSAPVSLSASIVAHGKAKSAPDISGTIILYGGGYNLIEDTTGAVLDARGLTVSNLTHIDPLIGPLTHDNEGTLTHALLQGSPAIDYVPCEPLVDQRGMPRPAGNQCDIGAYEYQ